MKMYATIVLFLLLKLAVSMQRIPNADDQLHIYALPVGQGDCTVIQCPKAKGDPVKGVVSIIDAGSSTDNIGIKAKDIVHFLAPATLHLVVITHSDKDHISYLDPILNNHKKHVSVHHPCKWNNKYTKYIKSKYADPQQVLDCQNIKDCADKLNLCPNYQPKFGKANSVTLSFVASAVGGCKNKRANNEDSLIAKITYAGISTLITGDFELGAKPMTNFLKKAKADLKSDIYKLSHHGAYNDKANRYKFLDAIKAEYVFSSSGFKYKHPRCEIFKYYTNRLPTGAVDKHYYTCFDGNDIDRNRLTSKAIYVTHLFRGESVMHWFISYYLLRFDIARDGGIGVDFKRLGDTNLPLNQK